MVRWEDVEVARWDESDSAAVEPEKEKVLNVGDLWSPVSSSNNWIPLLDATEAVLRALAVPVRRWFNRRPGVPWTPVVAVAAVPSVSADSPLSPPRLDTLVFVSSPPLPLVKSRSVQVLLSLAALESDAAESDTLRGLVVAEAEEEDGGETMGKVGGCEEKDWRKIREPEGPLLPPLEESESETDAGEEGREGEGTKPFEEGESERPPW